MTDFAQSGAMVGGALGSGIGGLIGYLNESGDRDKAAQLLQQADPTITPQQAQAVLAGSSAYNSVDPQTRDAQMQALGQLKNMWSQGGMDAQTQADIAGLTQRNDQNAQALQSSIQNQMAQRGMSSAGSNFAAQRQAAQNAANQGNLQGLQALGMGQQRAMGALQSYGQLASGTRDQDYQRAAANDAISRFNAGLATQNNQYNASNRQAAAQQSFNNDVGLSGLYSNKSDRAIQDTTAMGQGLGAGVVGMGGLGFDIYNQIKGGGMGGGMGGMMGGGGGGG